MAEKLNVDEVKGINGVIANALCLLAARNVECPEEEYTAEAKARRALYDFVACMVQERLPEAHQEILRLYTGFTPLEAIQFEGEKPISLNRRSRTLGAPRGLLPEPPIEYPKFWSGLIEGIPPEMGTFALSLTPDLWPAAAVQEAHVLAGKLIHARIRSGAARARRVYDLEDKIMLATSLQEVFQAWPEGRKHFV